MEYFGANWNTGLEGILYAEVNGKIWEGREGETPRKVIEDNMPIGVYREIVERRGLSLENDESNPPSKEEWEEIVATYKQMDWINLERRRRRSSSPQH